MAQSKYDQEKLVGILLRKIVGDIVRDFHNRTLKKIYKNKDGKFDDVDKNCMEWGDEIARYFNTDDPADRKKKNLYINLLIIYQDERIDPDKDELWKMLMKKDLPMLFYKRFEAFGQVPQVASLDISEPPDTKQREKSIKDVNW